MGRHKKAQLAIVRRFHRVTLYLVAFRLVLDRILIININEKKKNLVLLQGPLFLGLTAPRLGRRGCASYGPFESRSKTCFNRIVNIMFANLPIEAKDSGKEKFLL